MIGQVSKPHKNVLNLRNASRCHIGCLSRCANSLKLVVDAVERFDDAILRITNRGGNLSLKRERETTQGSVRTSHKQWFLGSKES